MSLASNLNLDFGDHFVSDMDGSRPAAWTEDWPEPCESAYSQHRRAANVEGMEWRNCLVVMDKGIFGGAKES